MMYDLHNNIDVVRAIQAQTITGSALVSGDLDLQNCAACKLVVDFGDIAEMGASPEGAAQIAIKLEHADDDGTGAAGTYANVTANDVVGPASVAAGVVSTPVSDLVPVEFGYVGMKRFIRVTLTPTGLATGGPVVVHLLKGMLKDKPAT